MTSFAEAIVEEATLAWLQATGWEVARRPDIAPDMPGAERAETASRVLRDTVDARLIKPEDSDTGSRK